MAAQVTFSQPPALLSELVLPYHTGVVHCNKIRRYWLGFVVKVVFWGWEDFEPHLAVLAYSWLCAWELAVLG